MNFEKLKDFINSCESATKAVWLLSLTILSMLLLALLLFVVVNSVQSLTGRHFEIILTFVGVIGTFVVITNFHQAEELKREFKEAIEQTNKKFEDFDNDYRAALEGIKKSDEYLIAERIVKQIDITDSFSKDTWLIEQRVMQISPEAYTTIAVHIEDVSINKDGKLTITFKDGQDHTYSYPNENIKSYRIGVFYDSRECDLDNPILQSFIRSILNNKQKPIV